MNDEIMLEALAEILGIDFDIIEMINPYIGEDTGSSGEVCYGYYAEFPDYEDLDDDIKERIDYNKDLLPFASTEYFTISDFANTNVDPFGWRAEYEEQTYLEQQMYYLEHIVPKENILNELLKIQEKINHIDDELLIKALILSAFSLVEGYLRGRIFKEIPEYKNRKLDDKMEKFIEKTIQEKLNIKRGREEIRDNFKIKLDCNMPNFDQFRNSLAHNIGDGKVNKGILSIKNYKGKIHEKSVTTILNELIYYVENKI